MLLHGDEGTGSKKQPVSIVNWQTVWGKSTATTAHMQAQEFGCCASCRCTSKIGNICAVPPHWPKASDANMALTSADLGELQTQFAATAGHSFLSRHLACVLPPHLAKKGPEVLQAVLQALAADLKMLCQTGIEVNGTRYFVALVSCKGDQKWHASVACLTRCYTHIGDIKMKPICSECMAGDPRFPMEDTTSSPAWVSTLFTSEPWDVPGVLEEIPFDETMPARKYKRDLLHVFKIGLGRDICGSLIMLLARHFRHFDCGDPGESIALGNRLKRAHSRFMLWCVASGSSPHLRGFTMDFMHLSRVSGYAYTNSKGSDTMLLLRWLRLELGLLHARLHQQGEREAIALAEVGMQICDSAAGMFRMLYSHGMWLPTNCMRCLRDEILVVCRSYSFLATRCLQMGFAGFSLKTTIHALHHFAVDLDLALQRGAMCHLSFLVNDCCQDEDFVGRTARVARATHSKTTAYRVLQRHLVKAKLLLKDRPSKNTKPRSAPGAKMERFSLGA